MAARPARARSRSYGAPIGRCGLRSPKSGGIRRPKRRTKLANPASRSARTISRKVLDLESHLRAGHLEKLGLRYHFPTATIVTSRRGSSSGRRSFRRCRHFSSIAAGWKTTCSRKSPELASKCSTGVVRDFTFGTPHQIRCSDTRRRTLVPGALAGRCQRPRRARATAPRPHQAGWSHRQRLLVPAAQLCPHRRVERRPRVARRTCPSGMRWHSTTHLIGRGYWVWLIPLGSGGISIGHRGR